MVIVIVIVILVLLPVIYNLLFPLTYPSLDNFFAPGQILESKWEGVAQKIIRQEGDKVYTEAILQPGAQGPPEHLHEGFSETAVVKQGILTVKVNGQTRE